MAEEETQTQNGAGAEKDGREERDSREDWKKLLALLIVHMPAYLRLGWALAKTPDIPRRDKTGLLGGVLYSLSPIDLVPGFIPVLGQLDDMGILLAGIRSALRNCPPETADRLLRESGVTREMLDRDMHSLGTIAWGFSRTVGKAAWRGGKALARATGRGLLHGAQALWDTYQSRQKPNGA